MFSAVVAPCAGYPSFWGGVFWWSSCSCPPTSTARSSCSWAVGRDVPCSALGIQIAWGKGERGVELTLCASKLPGETGKMWPHPYQGALCRGRKTAWAIYKRSSWATSVLYAALASHTRKREGKGAAAREKLTPVKRFEIVSVAV